MRSRSWRVSSPAWRPKDGESGADGFADLGLVSADLSGEDEGVQARERCGGGGDLLADAQGVDVNRELGLVVAAVGHVDELSGVA